MIVPNKKRHPNNTKTDQLPISEVITGLSRPYHNSLLVDPAPGRVFDIACLTEQTSNSCGYIRCVAELQLQGLSRYHL